MLTLTGALALGCDPATYTDQNFGTNLGADYLAPARDAGDASDDVVGPDAAGAANAGTANAGGAGTGGAAGQSGAAGSGS